VLEVLPLPWNFILLAVVFFNTLSNLQEVVFSASVLMGVEAEATGLRNIGTATVLMWCWFPIMWMLDLTH
jgi:hypothetical protein